jgi:hypothetical protein
MNHALLPKSANADLPASYEAAKYALAQCNKIDECKEWADKAQALASYARQSEDKEMETTAMRIRARAIRRCGELLKEIEKASNQHDAAAKSARGGTSPSTRKDAAKDAGLSKDQAKTAIRVANVPQETFVKQVESAKPPTITKLAEQGKTPVKSTPMYEKLGMTKQAFQAGMYFRGDVEQFIKAIRKYDLQDIVDGCRPGERAELRKAISEIDSFNDKLIAKL